VKLSKIFPIILLVVGLIVGGVLGSLLFPQTQTVTITIEKSITISETSTVLTTKTLSPTIEKSETISETSTKTSQAEISVSLVPDFDYAEWEIEVKGVSEKFSYKIYLEDGNALTWGESSPYFSNIRIPRSKSLYVCNGSLLYSLQIGGKVYEGKVQTDDFYDLYCQLAKDMMSWPVSSYGFRKWPNSEHFDIYLDFHPRKNAVYLKIFPTGELEFLPAGSNITVIVVSQRYGVPLYYKTHQIPVDEDWEGIRITIFSLYDDDPRMKRICGEGAPGVFVILETPNGEKYVGEERATITDDIEYDAVCEYLFG